MSITLLPTPPTTADPSTFDARADAFLAALPAFGTEANVLATDVNADEVAAAGSAAAAAASATLAASSSSAALWLVGTAYVAGSSTVGAAISAVNFQTYRCTVNVTGGVDPALDTGGTWVISGSGGQVSSVNTSGGTTNVIAGTGYDAISGANTYTLPTGSPNGMLIGPLRLVGAAATLTVSRNAATINGLSEDLVIDVRDRDVFLRGKGASGWYVS